MPEKKAQYVQDKINEVNNRKDEKKFPIYRKGQ